MRSNVEYLVITNLATTAALTTVENKIPNVSNLVKKNYNTKINETEQSINDHDQSSNILLLQNLIS